MHIIIDGKEYEVKDGETILQVAKRNNINIPTLCYDERFEPKTSCFLCVVEDLKTGRLVPSCSTFVSDGMELNTNNDLVKDARKTSLELLLSEHDASCFSPCKTACPSNIDARDYVLYTSKHEEYKGFKIIRKKNPLVASLGRVCPAFCEKKCNRGKVDETIAIRLLKKQIADITYDKYYDELLKDEKDLQKKLSSKTEKSLKIAIIGGGPAGLSSSYYLALNGHSVTIYDENEKLGGMLRYSIPEYRLPKKELDKEIDGILALGIATKLGKKITPDDIKQISKQYDFVILSTGTWKDTKIVNVGEFSENQIESALSYLKRMALKENYRDVREKNVLIIGGGNTAFDSARVSLRRGAKTVTVAYRRTISAMPAEKIEIKEAIEEGVKIIELISPKNIYKNQDNDFVLLMSKMKEIDELDSRARKKIVEIGEEQELVFDKLIYAAGQHSDKAFLEGLDKLNIANLFFAGDVKQGASTVIEAVASGRKTAEFIMGIKKDEMSFYSSRKSGVLPPRVLPKEEAQISPEYLSVEKRIQGDIVYELPYKNDEANTEAKRCLNCGCASVENCDLRFYSQEYDADPNILKLDLPHRPVRTVDAGFSPYMIHDNSKCIKCGQCIDVCTKVSGQSVLAFINRGYDVIVSSGPDDKIIDCSSCGACLDVCPTGAFSEKIKNFSYIETTTKTVDCNGCVMQCKLDLHYSRDNELMFVRGHGGEACKHIRWNDTRLAPNKETIASILAYKDKVITNLNLSDYDSIVAYKYCPKGDNTALFYKIEDFRLKGKVFHINELKELDSLDIKKALIVINSLEELEQDFKESFKKYSIEILLLHDNLETAF